ncbi:hypothetical protein EON63_05765 [archaeon]|nr:MAG: hypothetical protein EON63_05765 [archaeon]
MHHAPTILHHAPPLTSGGLSTQDGGFTLQDVRNISRFNEPSESGLMSDLLWSDPQPQRGNYGAWCLV